VRGALKDKTILLVTHQVDFLHNVDLILVSLYSSYTHTYMCFYVNIKPFFGLYCQVMREGMIVQSGKYNDLLDSGLDFTALVAAHDTSMELVEAGTTMPGESSPELPKSPHTPSNHGEANGENNSLDQQNSDKGTSKLIKEEERETGKVTLHIYKLYCTEAFGWWGVVLVLLLSLLWQGSQMAGDYWLAYETSEERATLFNPSLFISVYAIIAGISLFFILLRSFFSTYLGLKTAQIFFTQILHSILHAPMSFFDTTPSGRVLSRVRNQTMLVFIFISRSYSLLSVD
jgi:ATP-binding cassette subfamily C (CFTR/MRP) protein 2